MLIFGDLKFIFESYTLAIGDYIRHFVEYSLRINPYSGNNAWIQQWTVFYWAWVISWSPFIGGFVARVSRGRTPVNLSCVYYMYLHSFHSYGLQDLVVWPLGWR